jgi:hypothetical protein
MAAVASLGLLIIEEPKVYRILINVDARNPSDFMENSLIHLSLSPIVLRFGLQPAEGPFDGTL